MNRQDICRTFFHAKTVPVCVFSVEKYLSQVILLTIKKTPPPIGEAGSRRKAGLSVSRFPFDGKGGFSGQFSQKLYRMPPLT